ncbi:MAG TPA: indole-3-glycerol phosphate synthase TrpC [Chitinophagaceae bacterium]|nr:indole-3-glycerol phosphate synthase TrpC [Chitinophagaceae bacterium]
MFTKINQFAIMNILDKIVAYKKKEVEERKRLTPVSELEDFEFFEDECDLLKQSLLLSDATGIIAEFKRKSPSKGIINDKAGIFDVIDAYEMNGASGISILTDEKYFGGTIEDIYDYRAALGTPVLRKDFMIDEYQFYEAKAIGADVILLIAACLTPKQAKEFASLAKQLGLEVLLEIHNEEELEHICDEVDFVGVNNRNLKTFEVDINTSLNLIDKIPKDKIVIAESGISNVDTIITLKQAGFKGFLIGENFMKQPDPAIAFAEFVKELKAKMI